MFQILWILLFLINAFLLSQANRIEELHQSVAPEANSTYLFSFTTEIIIGLLATIVILWGAIRIFKMRKKTEILIFSAVCVLTILTIVWVVKGGYAPIFEIGETS